MAPPPTTNPTQHQRMPSGGIPPHQQTMQQRLQGVVQHQQFFWWVGHVIIVLATLFYALAWFRFSTATKMAAFWYRLAFLGAIGAYGVVVHKMFFRVSPEIRPG
jgi:transmembrane protein 33